MRAAVVRATIDGLLDAWGRLARAFRDDRYVLASGFQPEDALARLAPRLHSRYRRGHAPAGDACRFSGELRGRRFRVELLVDVPLVEAFGSFRDGPRGASVDVRMTVPTEMRAMLAGFFGLAIVLAIGGTLLALRDGLWPLLILPLAAWFVVILRRMTLRDIARQRQVLLQCLEEVFAARLLPPDRHTGS